MCKKMCKNITLNDVRNSAFLAKQSYESFEISPNSSEKTITNPAANSSFEVIDQKRDNNSFATMLVKNIDNNNANNIKYAIVYRGTDGINDISTNSTPLLDMRRLLLTHTLELRLSLYRDFALHLCGLSFLCHR